MTVESSLAPFFQFAGVAFLRPGRDELAALLAELREEAPDQEWASEVEALEEALAGDPLDLAKEHTRLFFDPYGAPFPPWQSTHTGEGLLMGEPHSTALAWYREEGFEPQLENEPADHIGLLLLFLGRLLEAGASEDRLRRFRDEHLAWTVPYLDGLAAGARHPFYVRLARFAGKLAAEV